MSIEINGNTLLSVNETAEKLGIHRNTLRQWIKKNSNETVNAVARFAARCRKMWNRMKSAMNQRIPIHDH